MPATAAMTSDLAVSAAEMTSDLAVSAAEMTPDLAVPSSEPTPDLVLPSLDLRALARRAAVPAGLAALAVAALVVERVHVPTERVDVLDHRREERVRPGAHRFRRHRQQATEVAVVGGLVRLRQGT